MDATEECAAIVRVGDRDRYLSDLLASHEVRSHLFALHAFDVEVATVRDKVNEPTLGEIRLEWWRQALRGDHGGNPVAAALAATIERFRLPLATFDNLLQARIFDLYDDPMPDVATLEGYAGDTASSVIQLGAIVLADGTSAGSAEAAGFGGVAMTLTQVLRDLPRNVARGQTFLPADRLAAVGVSPADMGGESGRAGLRKVAAELRALAARRLEEARAAMANVDRRLLPAFLPLATVGQALKRMEAPGFDPLRDRVDFSPLKRQWLIWRASRRGGV